MTRIEKLTDKFLRHPKSLKYREIEQVLLYLGFIKTYGKGSHVKFTHPIFNANIIISIHNNECKKIYKNEIAKTVRWLMGKA
jgi:predicted RNA binding protein YcfA (HicA-like mRNA interferase family)